METIAVYWEPVIRTYGFNLLQNQVFCQINLSLDQFNMLGDAFQQLDETQAGFRLVWSQAEQAHGIQFFLVCDEKHWQHLRSIMESVIGSGADLHLYSQAIVDIVFFHGPHFGDRYGILDYTFRALAPGQIPLLAATCSVATIYLVVSAGWGGHTKEVLSKTFEIPIQTKSMARHSSGV